MHSPGTGNMHICFAALRIDCTDDCTPYRPTGLQSSYSRLQCVRMLPLKILPLVLLAASVAVWAQSEPVSASNASTSANATAQQNAPGTLRDSTSLEPIKMKRADYPQLAAQRGLQGQVILKVTISEAGDVDEVEVVSGDPILADAAVRAAKKWKFKPFIKNGHPIRVATKVPMDFAFSGKIMDKGRSADGTTLAGKSTNKVPPALLATQDSNVDASAESDSSNTNKDGNPERVRVTQGVSEGLLIHQVAPIYPRAAMINRVQGQVVLRAVIGKDGRLSSLSVISGPPELRDAAIGAVQQWRYKPYYLKGERVEVETQITINFALR